MKRVSAAKPDTIPKGLTKTIRAACGAQRGGEGSAPEERPLAGCWMLSYIWYSKVQHHLRTQSICSASPGMRTNCRVCLALTYTLCDSTHGRVHRQQFPAIQRNWSRAPLTAYYWLFEDDFYARRGPNSK